MPALVVRTPCDATLELGAPRDSRSAMRSVVVAKPPLELQLRLSHEPPICPHSCISVNPMMRHVHGLAAPGCGHTGASPMLSAL